MNLLAYAGSMDIYAGCTQSARIAREEGFPGVSARMDENAANIQNGARILILDGIVETRTDETTVVKVVSNHIEYEVTVSVKAVIEYVWDHEAATMTRRPL